MRAMLLNRLLPKYYNENQKQLLPWVLFPGGLVKFGKIIKKT